jgi:hypothetical protein
MPDGVEVDLREVDLGDAWCDYRERTATTLAKLGGISDTFGFPSRFDLRRGRERATSIYGPDGMCHEQIARVVATPAAHTNLLLAGAVTAQCIGVVGVIMELVCRASQFQRLELRNPQ